MHVNTCYNDQVLLQHPSVGINGNKHYVFSFAAPTVWNKLPYCICKCTIGNILLKKMNKQTNIPGQILEINRTK